MVDGTGSEVEAIEDEMGGIEVCIVEMELGNLLSILGFLLFINTQAVIAVPIIKPVIIKKNVAKPLLFLSSTSLFYTK